VKWSAIRGAGGGGGGVGGGGWYARRALKPRAPAPLTVNIAVIFLSRPDRLRDEQWGGGVGPTLKMSGLSTDIEDRKRTEEPFAESEQPFRDSA